MPGSDPSGSVLVTCFMARRTAQLKAEQAAAEEAEAQPPMVTTTRAEVLVGAVARWQQQVHRFWHESITVPASADQQCHTPPT